MKINHVKSQCQKNCYYDLYIQGVKGDDGPGIIMRIAEKFDVTPCLVAKLILQKHFEEKNIVTDVESGAAGNVNIYLRDTTLITDKQLAYEVFLVHTS